MVVGSAAVGCVVVAASASSAGRGCFVASRLRFFVSGVGAGVGPCVFGCRRALVSSLALFGGLPLDPDYAVLDAKKNKLTTKIHMCSVPASSSYSR